MARGSTLVAAPPARPRPGGTLTPPRRAPAMCAVTYRPLTGHGESLRAWEADTREVASTFAGYLATDVLVSRTGQERTVVQCFSSTWHLETWLASEVRASLLRRGGRLFAAAPHQQLLVGEHDHDCVSVVRSYAVDATEEEAFLAWHQRTAGVQRAFPGFRGSEALPPAAQGQDTWTIVLRFASPLHLDHWLASAEHERTVPDGARFAGTPARGRLRRWRNGLAVPGLVAACAAGAAAVTAVL